MGRIFRCWGWTVLFGLWPSSFNFAHRYRPFTKKRKKKENMAQLVQGLVGLGLDAASNAALLVGGTLVASFAIPTLVGLRFLTAVRRRFATLRNPKGSVVIVTGAASGFGKQLTETLVAAGAYVFACDIDEAGLGVAFKGFPNVTTMRVDVSRTEDCKRLVAAAKDYCARNGAMLHGLVNNAGIAGKPGAVFEQPDQTIDAIFGVNILGIIKLTRECLPLLSEGQDARILNISSMAGYVSGRGLGLYSSTKFAVEAYSDALRQEVPKGVRVIVFNPYFAETNIYRSLREKGAGSQSVLKDQIEDFRAKVEKENGKSVPGMMSCKYVTDQMFDALYSTYPKDRYVVCPTGIFCFIEAMQHAPNYFGLRDTLAVLLRRK